MGKLKSTANKSSLGGTRYSTLEEFFEAVWEFAVAPSNPDNFVDAAKAFFASEDEWRKITTQPLGR